MGPARVSWITRLCVAESVSSCPNEPISGAVTDQSPVSFGHLEGSTYSPVWALKAFRSSEAVELSTSSPGTLSTFATVGPVRNERTFCTDGQFGRNSPVEVFHAPVKS